MAAYLRLHPTDNVVVAVADLSPGDIVDDVKILRRIPRGHKAAVRPIAKDAPGVGRLYLLTLANQCDALDSRVTLQVGGVDGVQGRLQAGTGDVIIGQLHCRVQQIQPIDLVALRASKTI